MNSMRAANGVKSFGFCSGVGGVAFGATASFSDGSKVTKLEYDQQRPDGQRLVVSLLKNGQSYTVTIPVYDWILVPVAKFANSDHDALFTLFGKLVDQEDGIRRQKAGQRILNYHPAIQDTFLGLRLMQSDLLAFHPVGPENLEENGRVLKAPGENTRSKDRNIEDFRILSAIYRQGRPQSYVITDPTEGVRVRLASTGGNMSIAFTGRPYWSCWRLTKDHEAIQAEFRRQPDTSTKLNERVHERMRTAGFSPLANTIRSAAEEATIQRFAQEESMALFSAYVDARYFEVLSTFSRSLSDKMEALEGGNPPVYQALCQTMWYAAFFRCVKASDPDAYRTFMSNISGLTPSPTAVTPTVLTPPNNRAE
jgi:hypothetical protein